MNLIKLTQNYHEKVSENNFMQKNNLKDLNPDDFRKLIYFRLKRKY